MIIVISLLAVFSISALVIGLDILNSFTNSSANEEPVTSKVPNISKTIKRVILL